MTKNITVTYKCPVCETRVETTEGFAAEMAREFMGIIGSPSPDDPLRIGGILYCKKCFDKWITENIPQLEAIKSEEIEREKK